MRDDVWRDRYGCWALPSFVARALCQSADLTPAELYFVLASLGVEGQFRDYWDHPEFHQRAGMGDQASASVDRQRDGWIALTGDHAWAAGDLDEAMRRYVRSIKKGETAGIAGQVRLHFARNQFSECINAFRRGCPPHAFYIEYRDLASRAQPDPGMEQFNRLCARFPGTSFCFLSQAKYMCRAIVAAAVRGGGIDGQLREMICDYFEIEPTELDELVHILSGNEKELAALQRRVTPKPVVCGRTFDDLIREGDTQRGQHIRDCLPLSKSFAMASADVLDRFLKTGKEHYLDELIRIGSPFSIAAADSLIIQEALYSRTDLIATMPVRHLSLLRRFSPICRYPKYSFLDEYLYVMGQVEAKVEPGDVVNAILDLAWYKTPYSIDRTGLAGIRGGLGKTEIRENREWLEIILLDYPSALDRAAFATRERAVEALFAAYQYLRQRFVDVRGDERWISEAQLGQALCTLFRKEEVQRHARPLWLSPQHLDYFLPSHRLAIEYMGAQHYQPVQLFGGPKAFDETRARDERKRALCERMGVTLVYVTYEEDIGRRALEIFNRYSVRGAKGGGSGRGTGAR